VTFLINKDFAPYSWLVSCSKSTYSFDSLQQSIASIRFAIVYTWEGVCCGYCEKGSNGKIVINVI
jgi:hypothetical protein